MPMSDTTVDRATIRQMIEDFWRSGVLFGRHWGETHPNADPESFRAAATDFSERFWGRIDATAELMPLEQAKIFRQIVAEEDTICFGEHQNNTDAFYRRLGLNLTRTPVPSSPVVYHRQGLGELAVRTAVRATVWQLIWSLFRR